MERTIINNSVNDVANSPGNLLAAEDCIDSCSNAGRPAAEKRLNNDSGGLGKCSMKIDGKEPAGSTAGQENVLNQHIKINGYKPSGSVHIPEQLQNDTFRFCKVEKHDKKPFEHGWSKKGYQWNDPALQTWLRSGGNYGCIGGFGDLVIFDADDLARLQELGVIAAFPETFTIRTPGRGGWHMYYVCPGIGKKQALYDPDKTFINDKGQELFVHVADLVGHGLQAVGPNSVRDFPNDTEKLRAYEIIKDLPIAEITLQQLQDVTKGLKTSPKVKKEPLAVVEENKPRKAGYNRWSDSLHVEDVMLPINPTKDERETSGELQGSHPIHGSEGGHNFAINVKKNTWICYRCGNDKNESGYSGGGPWELLGVREGILSCDDCYKGWRQDRPDLWAEVLKRAEELGYDVPKGPYGDSLAEFRRDIIRYAVEVIMGSEYVKTLATRETRNLKRAPIVIYENGVYRFGGVPFLESMIQQLGGPQTRNGVVEEVIGQIKRLTLSDPHDFDKEPYRISVKNGILNLETGLLETHSPDFLSLIQIPWDYKPGATCPGIEKFVSEIVNKDDILVMEEIAGSCLIKNYSMKRSPWLIGDTNSGKTLFLTLLRNLLGDSNLAVADLQKLARKFQTWQLDGKLACIGDDLDSVPFRSAMFRQLTGNGPTQAERKGQDVYWFVNFCKLIFGSNTIPQIEGLTDADVERIMPIMTPWRFGTQEEIEEGIAQKLKDPKLIDKLLTPDEMKGFLAMAVRGAIRLMAQGEFSYKTSKLDIAQMLSSAYDPKKMVGEFGTEACMRMTNIDTPLSDFYEAFKTWAMQRNYGQPIGKNVFLSTMTDVFCLKRSEGSKWNPRTKKTERQFLNFALVTNPKVTQAKIAQAVAEETMSEGEPLHGIESNLKERVLATQGLN